jgi:hypothetical protein
MSFKPDLHCALRQRDPLRAKPAPANLKQASMLTIHGVPLSVHTRKTLVTAIVKNLDYRFRSCRDICARSPHSTPSSARSPMKSHSPGRWAWTGRF